MNFQFAMEKAMLSFRGMVIFSLLARICKGGNDFNHSNSAVYITGIVQNVSKHLDHIHGNVKIISKLFSSCTTVIYADPVSTNALEEWKASGNDIHYIEENIDGIDREERNWIYSARPTHLANARNQLIDYVLLLMQERHHPLESTFLIMMDFDGATKYPINATFLDDVLSQNSQWDVVSFNRKHYYDIWALRYERFNFNVWSIDPPSDAEMLIGIIGSDIMKQLHKCEASYYPVYSAFGGFAVYKMGAIDGCRYDAGPEV